MKASEFLTQALAEMTDRARTYDRPEGERSMGRTVEAFRAVTGVSMTETQGWLFMALLKAVRSQQGAYRADSFIDGAAYFALAGESADKSSGDTDSLQPKNCEVTEQEDEAWDEKRADLIGLNGNDGLHYPSDPCTTAFPDRNHDWQPAFDPAFEVCRQCGHFRARVAV